MAEAHYLSDKDGKKFYPYAHASTTYDNNGNTVENRLKALDKTTASAVQSVKIGTTEYKSGTTVTLPSYPTSLPASDVPSWAKQKTKPTYTASEIGLGNVGNFKAVSTVESQGLTDTEKSNARANIGAQVAGSYASANHNHDDKYQAKGSYASASHTHGNGDITSLDASKITSGTISIDRLPQGALERLTVVADDTARFKLTSTSVQKGDTVKVTSTGKMYYVVDETKLSSEAGYEVYAAGTAASVPWSGVTNKPSTYTPSSHTHTKSQITDFPTNMPANGGNSSTVNGYTVNADVPSGAKFTDTNTWRPQPDWNATSGDAVIKNKPTIPRVGNGTVTITQNGTSKGTFTMNQSGNTTIALTDTNTDTNTVTNIGTTASNYTNGNILIQGSGATTVSKSGNTVTISSTNTDTNTWRPLGTTADTACAGNDSRLSNARPANGGTSTYANYVWATSHKGSWYQNSQWDGTYFQTNYKNGDNVLPMRVNNAGYADSAGSANSVAWSNVSGRPSSLPANGGNSDTVDGFHASQTAGSKKTCVVTDANGYTNLNYINSNTGNSENPSISQVIVTNGSDNYYRKASLTHLKNSLGGMPASDVYSWAKASSKPSYTASEVGAAPANHSHSNYLTGITKSMVTSALGYTPPRVIIQSSEPTISTNDEWLLEY